MGHFDLKIGNTSKQTMTDHVNSNCDRYPAIANKITDLFKFAHFFRIQLPMLTWAEWRNKSCVGEEKWPSKVEHFEKIREEAACLRGWVGVGRGQPMKCGQKGKFWGGSSLGQLFSGNLQPPATVYTSLLLHSYLLSSVSSHKHSA